MKRSMCVSVTIAMMLSLCACNFSEKQATGTVTFYYVRNEITCGNTDSLIAGEVREVQSYTDNLRYLLLLYLGGPASSELRSPFPAGLRLVQLEQNGDSLEIVLGSSFDSLGSLEKTLACACLTLTCMELTDAASVSISTEAMLAAGENPIVMDSSCLLLLDDSAAVTDPTGQAAG